MKIADSPELMQLKNHIEKFKDLPIEEIKQELAQITDPALARELRERLTACIEQFRHYRDLLNAGK